MKSIISIFQFIIVLSWCLYLLFSKKKKMSSAYVISLIVLVGLSASIFKHFLFGHFLGLGYPDNSFLFNPNDRFNDFFNMLDACKDNNPYSSVNFLPSVYFPVANSFFFLLYKISFDNKIISVIIFIVSFLCLFILILSKAVKGADVKIWQAVIIFGMAYGTLFSIDRMNLELILFLFVFLSTYFFSKERYFLSAILLCFPICMKLYPCVFLIFFLKEKKFREFGIAILTCSLMSIISVLTFKGNAINNLVLFKNALNSFSEFYSGASGLSYNLSVYGSLKILVLAIVKFFNHSGLDDKSINIYVNHILKYPYLIFVFIYSSFIFLYVMLIEKEYWKILFLITSLILLLPHVSFDYKLLHIFVSLCFFLKSEKNHSFYKYYSILFGLLLLPNNYFYLRGGISIGVLIYPVIIIIMVWLIVYESSFTGKKLRNLYNFKWIKRQLGLSLR